jgi:hypothetical protein
VPEEIALRTPAQPAESLQDRHVGLRFAFVFDAFAAGGQNAFRGLGLNAKKIYKSGFSDPGFSTDESHLRDTRVCLSERLVKRLELKLAFDHPTGATSPGSNSLRRVRRFALEHARNETIALAGNGLDVALADFSVAQGFAQDRDIVG